MDHGKIQTDIDSKVDQIESIISAAQFNGANLLTSTIDGTATEMGVLASLDRVGAGGTVTSTDITISAQGFDSTLDLATDLTVITDTATAGSALAEIETFLQTAISGAAVLGAASARIDDQAMFVANLVDSMTLGVSTMTDTNMEESSARLSALQTQQELAVQSLGIANEAPQALLHLFN